MQNKQRYITAGVTIAAAAVTAHLMQSDAGSGSGQAIGPATAGVVPNVSELIAPAPKRAQNEVTVVAVAQREEILDPVKDTVLLANAAPVLEVELPRTIVSDATSFPNAAVPDAPPQQIPVQVALADPGEEDGRAVETGVELIADFPAPPADVIVPDPLPQTGANLANRMQGTEIATPNLDTQPVLSQFGLTCGPILSASPVLDGLMNVILTAPCRQDEMVTVVHDGLVFTDQLDNIGSYQITIPAMANPAKFSVRFKDGELVETEVNVEGLDALERVALVADQSSGLQIHALEFGATYGESGHVWAENPGNAALGALDGKGYMIRLGNDALPRAIISEVYTFPRAGSEDTGTVRLSVEAAVTLQNCATKVSGVTIEPEATGMSVARSLEVAMPDCDAVGEFLVLKNLLRDLRIVSN